MSQAIQHPYSKKWFFDKDFIQEAVDIVIGDDGFRSAEVLQVLEVLLKEAQQ